METLLYVSIFPIRSSINCTLRNGNLWIIRKWIEDKNVLIVPCGMETDLELSVLDAKYSINCTLRNGNNVTKAFSNKPGSINCTLRNGNLKCTNMHTVPDNVLIVPCGMETEDEVLNIKLKGMY